MWFCLGVVKYIYSYAIPAQTNTCLMMYAIYLVLSMFMDGTDNSEVQQLVVTHPLVEDRFVYTQNTAMLILTNTCVHLQPHGRKVGLWNLLCLQPNAWSCAHCYDNRRGLHDSFNKVIAIVKFDSNIGTHQRATLTSRTTKWWYPIFKPSLLSNQLLRGTSQNRTFS